MAFESDVVVKELGDDIWELREPLRYAGNNDMFVVPTGFHTDFASVPRLFVWLLPKYGKYTRAAILHDFLCDEARAGHIDRDDADGLFRRSMRELGVSFLRRWIMWAAVAVATQWLKLRGRLPGRVRAGRVVQLLVIGVPGLVFFATPALVVLAWLVVFWMAEAVVYLGLRVFGRPGQHPPKLTWRL
jgi:hypothetical protein